MGIKFLRRSTDMQNPIRHWFEQHDGDEGDFNVAPQSYPFDVIPPTEATAAVLYCTKPHTIRELLYALKEERPGDTLPFAAVLRRGLPSEADATWLAATTGSCRLLFLGDADPADLLIYAWLRERASLHENLAIEYCGLSDALLAQCGVPFEDRLTIEMKPSERAAMRLVADHLGDLPALLGPWCAGLLTTGQKIELEALFSFSTTTPPQIATAILAKCGHSS